MQTWGKRCAKLIFVEAGGDTESLTVLSNDGTFEMLQLVYLRLLFYKIIILNFKYKGITRRL